MTLGLINRGQIYLDVKLEFLRRRRRWRNAGEYRNITIDVGGTLIASGFDLFNSGREVISFRIQQSYNCRTSNVRIPLFSTVQFFNDIQWEVIGGGLITQHVNGDIASNKFNNNVRW